MTGILDRLERGKWVARDRDSEDRRAVLVRALTDRNADLMRVYSPMSNSMNEICAGYEDAELEVIADFLRRTASAGGGASEALDGASSAGPSAQSARTSSTRQPAGPGTTRS
jgi:hypothetical protein